MLRQLADVAEGKKDLNEVINSITSNLEERNKLKNGFDKFKEVVSDLKKNVKEQIKDEIRKNDLQAKYETDAAMEVKDSQGNTIGYIGLKSKQKKAWIDKMKEDMATSLHNSADLLTNKKTFKEVQREQWSKIHQDNIETSTVYRHASGITTGIYKGVKKTIEELRGIKNRKQSSKVQSPANKYAQLDETQFRVSLGAAYDNFARLEHFNVADDVKNEVLQEINLVLEEAKKRYPDAKQENTQGTYFKDKDVAGMEQQLMPYMREVAKSDFAFAQEVNRFEAWRNGNDAAITAGALTVKEMPFENAARWGNVDKIFNISKATEGDQALNYFFNPYESGKKVMSQKDLAIAKAQAEKLVIR